ncbi:MAG: PhzF family phenazine biosynthesis protein [Saprospiraceae bacterium]|nr:PhzF family phenazine biosynthesis protein [Saprospiraceae bacterium]
MKEFNFKKMDAFATSKSAGNPAGCIFLNSVNEITPGDMLRIAQELQGFVNEVGYVFKTNDDQYQLKFYSSEREVDFCGHATIAIMYDMLKNDPDLQLLDTIQIKTNRGILKVLNRIKNEDALFIFSPEPYEIDVMPGILELSANMKISSDIIDNRFPISIINAGLSTLIVPIKTLNGILNITPELDMLKDFCIKYGIDIIEVFTGEVTDSSSNYRTRVFAPTFGYLEDPATGSGNSAFGYYLIKNNMWQNDTVVTIEQNGEKEKFNIVKLQKHIDEKGNIRVLFGGGAITRIKGKYLLH